MLVVGETLDLFRSISDKEFTANSSDVAATTVLIDAKPLGVLTEPKQIAPGLRKHSRQVGRHFMFFDRDWLVHGLMIGCPKSNGQLVEINTLAASLVSPAIL